MEQINENTKWTTFKGRTTSFAETDHQHLSNIVHYSTYIFPAEYLIKMAKRQISDRFNGQLLPYRPHPEFGYELKILNEKRMLKNDIPNNRIVIRDFGREIGEIREYQVEELLSPKRVTDVCDPDGKIHGV